MGGWELAALVVLVGAAACAQSLTGFGFGLMLVPPLVLIVGAKEAVLVSNVLSTALVVALVVQRRALVEWRTWAVLMVGTIAGMPLGLLVMVKVDADLLQLIIALNVIVFTVLLSRGLRLHTVGVAGDAAAGLLSGVLRTSTSMSGPPIVLYLQGRGTPPDIFRATISAVFLAGGLIAMATFALAGRFTGETWVASGIALPAVFGGMLAGNALYSHVDEARFRSMVQILLLGSAVLAIAMVFAD